MTTMSSPSWPTPARLAYRILTAPVLVALVCISTVLLALPAMLLASVQDDPLRLNRLENAYLRLLDACHPFINPWAPKGS